MSLHNMRLAKPCLAAVRGVGGFEPDFGLSEFGARRGLLVTHVIQCVSEVCCGVQMLPDVSGVGVAFALLLLGGYRKTSANE